MKIMHTVNLVLALGALAYCLFRLLGATEVTIIYFGAAAFVFLVIALWVLRLLVKEIERERRHRTY